MNVNLYVGSWRHLFIYVLTTSILIKFNQIIPIFTGIILIEHLYNWSLALESSSPKDFRAFIADEYSKYWYAGISIGISMRIPSGEWLGYWSLFAFGLNFIFWRLVAQAGVEVLEKAAPNPSTSLYRLRSVEENIQTLEDILYYVDESDDKMKLLERQIFFLHAYEQGFRGDSKTKSMIDTNKSKQGIIDFMRGLIEKLRPLLFAHPVVHPYI